MKYTLNLSQSSHRIVTMSEQKKTLRGCNQPSYEHSWIPGSLWPLSNSQHLVIALQNPPYLLLDMQYLVFRARGLMSIFTKFEHFFEMNCYPSDTIRLEVREQSECHKRASVTIGNLNKISLGAHCMTKYSSIELYRVKHEVSHSTSTLSCF